MWLLFWPGAAVLPEDLREHLRHAHNLDHRSCAPLVQTLIDCLQPSCHNFCPLCETALQDSLLGKSASKTLAPYQNDAEPASKRTRNGDGNKLHGKSKGKGKQDKQSGLHWRRRSSAVRQHVEQLDLARGCLCHGLPVPAPGRPSRMWPKSG